MAKLRSELDKKVGAITKERDQLLRKLSALDGGKAAYELEMQRKLEEEKEKRVQHLGQLGIKRMINGAIARGWSAWHDKWAEKQRQHNLLKKAGGRLTKPKLSAAYNHWLRDWSIAQEREKALAQEGRTADEAKKALSLRQEVSARTRRSRRRTPPRTRRSHRPPALRLPPRPAHPASGAPVRLTRCSAPTL